MATMAGRKKKQQHNKHMFEEAEDDGNFPGWSGMTDVTQHHFVWLFFFFFTASFTTAASSFYIYIFFPKSQLTFLAALFPDKGVSVIAGEETVLF